MRHIEKGLAPKDLEQYRRDGGAFRHLPTEIKNEIRRQGLLEQGGLCAFCCGPLPDLTPRQIIAHVVPRDALTGDVALELTYKNMVISCTGRSELDPMPAAPSDHHSCDNLQRNRRLPISPLQSDCQSRFRYDINGAIKGIADERDERETIRILGLDCMRLQMARKAAYEEALEDLTEFGTQTLKTKILGHDQFPLQPFLPALEYLFRD